MEGIFVDDCLKYLIEAQRYVDMYEEIDSYSEIFEASDPEVARKIQNNEIASDGASENIGKASNALVRMIQNIIRAIKNFFAKRNVDGAKRAAIDEYKAACAKDPSLRNKKINVLDVNKFSAAGNDLIKEAEAIDAKLANGQDADVSDIMNRLTKFCSGAASGFVAPIAVDAALQIASSSQEIAKRMLAVLNSDLELVKQLDDSIGKRNRKKFTKDIKAMTKEAKRLNLRRKILQAKGYQSSTCEEAIEKTFKSVQDLIGGGSDILGVLFGREDGYDPSKNGLRNTIKAGRYYYGKKDELKQGLENMGGGKNIAMNMAGNKQIQDIVKTGMNTIGQGKRTARDQYKASVAAEKQKAKDAKAAEKYRKKVAKDPSNQTMQDAIFGNNDPNSTLNKSKLGRFAQRAYDAINN